MRERLQAIWKRYGQTVSVETKEEVVPVRAFLQPSVSRDEEEPSSRTEIGWRDGRRWLYLGERVLHPGETVVWKGLRFRVRSSRAYWLGEVLLYGWASLECCGEVREVEGTDTDCAGSHAGV